jgi:survival-of-motor-neuron-related-splicing factor 30
MELQSIEDLQKQLREYNAQLDEVNEALQEEPDNEELLEVKKNLVDVIKMTQDLLDLRKQVIEKNKTQDEDTDEKAKIFQDIALRKGFYVGMPAEAKWSDGQWYPAKISDINANGFFVIFDGFEEPEQVSPDDIRPRQDKTFLPRKRKEPETSSSFVLQNIPKSLQILPTDSESVRKAKKKRIKALKAQARLKQAEEERNARKQAWQNFLQQGIKRVKTGIVTPKESIFKSPDTVEGKVGVTGSGKGMTPAPQVSYKPQALKASKPNIPLPSDFE